MKLNLPELELGLVAALSGEPYAAFYSTQQYSEWLREIVTPVLAAVRNGSETRDPVISFVLEYLDKHYGEDINLNLVADKLNLTPGYLSSIFKEKTGINFSEYLNTLRIERAKALLMNIDLRIQDIALQVGYQNVNSFIRMFKRASGLTPGEYRKRASGIIRGWVRWPGRNEEGEAQSLSLYVISVLLTIMFPLFPVPTASRSEITVVSGGIELEELPFFLFFTS